MGSACQRVQGYGKLQQMNHCCGSNDPSVPERHDFKECQPLNPFHQPAWYRHCSKLLTGYRIKGKAMTSLIEEAFVSSITSLQAYQYMINKMSLSCSRQMQMYDEALSPSWLHFHHLLHASAAST